MRLEAFAAACAVGFVCVLALAAYWDPTIRVLHTFEAVPYVVAAALCLRRRTAGYALAIAGGLVWLSISSLRTTFVRNGFERLAMLLRTGHVDRPDVLIAAPAAIFTGGLALCGAAAYATHARKRPRDLLLLLASTAGVIAWFITLFALFGPRYLRLFGL